MTESSGDRATRRAWAALPEGSRDGLVDGLSPSDLQTVLLDVSRARAAKVTPARVFRRWQQDRFVRPSAADPRRLVQVQAALWERLPDRFAGVELSPLAPLGTCSAVTTVDQNTIVATIRGTEVASDPTNELAVEAAVRRRAGQARVDLAACQRVVRAQALTGPGLFAHFQLFVLVSSARDTGSGRTEAELLVDHLTFWQRALGERARLTFTTFGHTAVRERIDDTVRPALRVELAEDQERTQGSGYYAGTALGIGYSDAPSGGAGLADGRSNGQSLGEGSKGGGEVRSDNDQIDAVGNVTSLGDGGFTRWTADLLGDAKERCLISCVSTERLAEVLGPDTSA